jgi:hypothetical protein
MDRVASALTRDDGHVPLETSGDLRCTLECEDPGFNLRLTDASEPRQDI